METDLGITATASVFHDHGISIQWVDGAWHLRARVEADGNWTPE